MSSKPEPPQAPEAIAAAILELVSARGAGKTICPSEAARAVDPEHWRGLMKQVRAVAADLADEGRIRVTRKGRTVNLREVKGVIRLGLPVLDPSDD